MKFYFIIIFFIFSFAAAQQKSLQDQVKDNLVLLKSDLTKGFEDLKKLEIQAKKENDGLALLEVINNKAFYYFISRDYQTSYNYSRQLIDEAKAKNDHRLTSLGMNRLGITLSFLQIYDDAEATLNAATKFIQTHDFEDKHFILAQNYQFLSDYYTHTEKFDKALEYIKKTLPEYQQIEDENERQNQVAKANSNIGLKFLAKNNDSAIHYFNRSLESQKEILPKSYNVANYVGLGESYFNKKDYKKAIEALKKGEKMNAEVQDSFYMEVAYDYLNQSYAAIGDEENSKHYKMLYLEAKNASNEEKLSGVNSVVQDVKKESEQQIAENRKNWYIGIGITVVSLTLLILLLNQISSRYRAKNSEATIIRKELEEKEKKIENLEVKMSDLHSEVAELAKNNDTKFYPRFLDLYPDFEKKLLEINPKLTNSELQFCALLKLNFSSKQIAACTFTAVRTVQNKKYRIRGKLNIPNETDTYVFFHSI